MRYFCLTSIDVEEHVPPNNPWNTIFNISFDPEEMEKRIRRFKEYVFSEIQIGFLPGTKTYMFVIHRHTEPDPYYYIAMKPGVLAVLESKRDLIDITINISIEEDQRNFFRENVKPTKIRIRNIKNNIVKGIRHEDHKNYQAYLKTIKNYCAENPGRSIEDAFDENEMPASLISGVEKSLTNKVAEIRKAISDLCGSIVNISDSARYNKPLDTIFFGCTDTNIYIKDKKDFDDKIRDNKLKWAYLNFESIAFSEFEKGWFDAVNIFALELRNVTISNESQNLWQNFAEGIQNMEKLNVFTLSADLKEISSIVFQYLPISITHLDFSDNNLTSIPSKINRLINLQSLILTNNKMLTENGIPWKSLPETLKFLYLNNTGITEIPKNIAHLTSLLDLNLKDTKLEKIAWTSLNKNLKYLEIEFAENFDGIIELPDLESLEMKNILYYQSINYEKLPVTLTFLDLCNCKIDDFRFVSNMLNLKSLHLSENQMTSIPWKYFPESLRILNLSHNNIEDIGSMKFWKKLTKLDLSYNKVKMFEYYFDEDVYVEIDPLTDYKKKGIFLNLYHNELESLPYGFENFTPLAGLNIGHNKFNTVNLNDALWKRLPSNGLLKYLCLNENKLNALPCLLKNFPLKELEAVDCYLYYICPQIPRNLEDDEDYILNISKNTDLERLPFIPKIVLPPPVIGTCAEIEYPKPSTLDLNRAIREPKFSIKIITDSSKFRCPESKKRQKQLSFTFKKKSDVKNIKYFCKCCARCGEIADEKIIEQMITMDCKICKTKQDEKIWKPGAWKSCINTRLCEDCKSWYKNEAKKITVNLEVENEREKEENSKKMKSIFDDEAEEMELMEVTNYEGNYSFQFNPRNDGALPSITDLYSNGIDSDTLMYVIQNSTLMHNREETYYNNFVEPDSSISQICYYPTTVPCNPSGPGPSNNVTPVQQQFITQGYYQLPQNQSCLPGPSHTCVVEPIQSTSNIYYQIPQQQMQYSDISSTSLNQHQTYKTTENDYIPQFHYLNNMQVIKNENVVGFENSQQQQQPPSIICFHW